MNRVFDPKLDNYKLVVVGSGLYGLTFARLWAEQMNSRCLVIERRSHIGGNAWSEIDPESGIEVHTYGSHLFHTSNDRVWSFVNRFTTFNDYRHRVYSRYQDQFFSIPINLQTLSQFFKRPFTPHEAQALLASFSEGRSEPTSFEDEAIRTIGHDLYMAFFKGYTQKQWQLEPKLLPRETFTRIPVRFDFNPYYFNDTHEGLPSKGYGDFLTQLATHPMIDISLNTDYFEFPNERSAGQLLVYTGPLDKYFSYCYGHLRWRTLDFSLDRLPISDFQGNAVINYPEVEYPFTRIHEFRHLNPERSYPNDMTIIMREYSRAATQEDEPYYPVNSLDDRIMLTKYRELMKAEKNVLFGGRLGTYKYLDMHMAIASAISAFEAKFQK